MQRLILDLVKYGNEEVLIIMTHSLHRRGKKADLREDYVILAMLAKDFNEKFFDSRQRLIRVGEILNEYRPINIMKKELWKVSPVVTATYSDIKTVKRLIKTLKQEDLGISIVVSGLLDEIQKMASKIKINLHTVHFSLGVFGKKELLPHDEILEITTMCGHHCISPQSVEYYVKLIRNRKISVQKAAKKLKKPCVCGIFNTSRAVHILNRIIKEHS